MKTYRVREGFAVRESERVTHQGGDVVELDDQAAALHAHKLEPHDSAAHEEAVEEAEERQPHTERNRK